MVAESMNDAETLRSRIEAGVNDLKAEIARGKE